MSLSGLGRKLIFYVSTYLLLTPCTFSQENPSQADLDALGRTITRVQSQIEETRRQRGQLETNIEASEREIAALLASISEVQEQIGAAGDRLSALEAQAELLNTQRLEQQDQIAKYLRAAYQNGQEEYLKLLLNQENISQSARVLRYYQYFSVARSEKIDEFDTILQEIDFISAEILETRENLQAQQTSLQRTQLELQAEQEQREGLMQTLDLQLASSNSELSRLEVQYAEMELLLEELARAILDLPLGSQAEEFSALRGALPWPIEGRLLNRFGTAYEGSDLRWEGITIAGSAGADIRAVHRGRVIYADWFSSSGLLLIIDHGGGYMSLYAHNQLLYKAVGDWVLAGEPIAALGNTGGRGEEGVYFEVRFNGDAQDPLSWLRAR